MQVEMPPPVAPPDRNLGLYRALADLRRRQALVRDGTALLQLTRLLQFAVPVL